MCKVGPFDLLYESLTSREAWQALCDLPNTDPTFFTEISQPRSCYQHVVPILNDDQAAQEDLEVQYSGANALDDQYFTLPHIVWQTLVKVWWSLVESGESGKSPAESIWVW